MSTGRKMSARRPRSAPKKRPVLPKKTIEDNSATVGYRFIYSSVFSSMNNITCRTIQRFFKNRLSFIVFMDLFVLLFCC